MTLKEGYVILKHEQYSNKPMIYSRKDGNLNNGRYDTDIFRGVRFYTKIDAKEQIKNEIQFIKDNDLFNAIFTIETIYF